MTVEHTYEALYYPFVHFRDEAWVKGMSLFWDGFARIVPGREYPVRDGDDICRLYDAGVVRNVYPRHARLKASAFLEAIVEEHHDEIVRRYAVSLKHNWPDDPVTTARAQHGDPRLAYLHVDKMHHQLGTTLLRHDLAERDRSGDSHWIGMHPRLIDTYMVILADVIAEHEAACPLTDDVTSHRVTASGGPLDAGRLVAGLLDPTYRHAPATGPDVERVLVAVAFDSLLPDFRHVPVDTVLKVRSESTEARTRFQEGVAELIRPDLFAGANRDAIEREMRRVYDKRIVPALAALETANKRFNIDTIKNSLSVKTELTGLAAALTSFAHGPAAWAIGGLAMAFGLHDVIITARDKRARAHANQPVASYLSTLREQITPADLAISAVG